MIANPAPLTLQRLRIEPEPTVLLGHGVGGGRVMGSLTGAGESESDSELSNEGSGSDEDSQATPRPIGPTKAGHGIGGRP